MNGQLKRLYYWLPPALQDLAISAMGWRLRRLRFGAAWRRIVDGLMESQWWTAEQHQANQLAKLRSLMDEAAKWTTYYRETFATADIKPDDIASFDDLRRLPLLEKDVLRARTADFHNLAPWRKPVEVELTSGSTGTPLRIAVDRESISMAVALLERQYRWAGVSFFRRHARLAGALISDRDDPGRPYRYNYAWNQMLCSSYHLTVANLPRIAKAMAKFGPEYLHCYPSAGAALARWLNDEGLIKSRLALKAVISTAETLYGFQRDEMEKAFGCKVWNQYGSAEGAPFIGQCEHGRLHVNHESGVIEFLRPDGSQADAGEEAEMVVTSFRSYGVPLIRYRIGDFATFSDERCPCGRNMTVVNDIHGRHDDVMVTTERGVVGRLSQVSKVAPQSFVQSQIEEVELDVFVFRYVPDPRFFRAERDLAAIERDMKMRLGSRICVRFESMNEIPRGARGKFRAMIGLPRDKWPAEYR